MSTTSKEAIGVIEDAGRSEVDATDSLVPVVGGPADFLLMHEARGWQTAVLSPSFDRTTVFHGRKVALRRASSWTVLDGTENMQGDGVWRIVPR